MFLCMQKSFETMQNMPIMQKMQKNIQNWTSKSKPTKPSLLNQTCQTKPTRQNLPNQTYQTNQTKPSKT